MCHMAAALCAGLKRCAVEITPFGGMMDLEGFELLAPCRQTLCALAGVAGSLMGAVSCATLLKGTEFGKLLFYAHFSLGALNCLPAWPLDGARALVGLAAAFGAENGMRKALSVFSHMLGAALVGLGLFGVWKGHINLSLLAAGPYLIYVARQGNVADKLRRMQSGQRKLSVHSILPIRFFATSAPDTQSHFAAWAGQWNPNQYHMLCEMDADGKVKRMWTETEMWNKALETIDDRQEVDKSRYL